MRLFVAVRLPGGVRRAIVAARAPLERLLDDVRWTEPDALHVTLCFIGEVAGEAVAPLTAAVAAAANGHAPFTIRLAGVGTFPSPGRARLWWVGVEDAGALHAVQADLARRLAALGVAGEDRPFTPHVTIGRRRSGRGAARARPGPRLPAVAVDASVRVQSLDLMRSHTGGAAARYECVAAAPLDGGRN